MFKLKIKDWRVREVRMGRFAQNQLVIDCELEPNERQVQIVSVVLSDEEAEDVYNDIVHVVNAGNGAIENS